MFAQVRIRIVAIPITAVMLCLAGGFWRRINQVQAQQLSIRHYDVSDGLAHSHVSAMHQDAMGYLWLATWEGLSRFDGYRFRNYTQREGLADPIINDIAEDRQGRLWVATNGAGVARLIDDREAMQATGSNSRQKFIGFHINDSVRANRVNALVFDAANNLWCATDGGLFRGVADQSGNYKFQLVVPYEGETSMVAFADHLGRLWFGIENDLIEIAGEQVVKYASADEVGRHPIRSITEDKHGKLMVANELEIFEFLEPLESAGRGRWRKWPLTFKTDQGINTMLSDSAGALWIGTWDGLIKYRDGRQTLYTSAQGVSDNNIASLTEDREGNLWIGTIGGGVCKLSSEFIVSFTRTEGLPNQDVRKVIEDRQGHIYASIENGGLVRIYDGSIASPTNANGPLAIDISLDWQLCAPLQSSEHAEISCVRVIYEQFRQSINQGFWQQQRAFFEDYQAVDCSNQRIRALD